MSNQVGKLPAPAEIVQFLKKLEGEPASKREIAKHFKIHGQKARADLKSLLKKMVFDGLIQNDKAKTFYIPLSQKDEKGKDTLNLVVVSQNDDGELLCEPTHQNLKDDYPIIVLDTSSAATIGDTIVAEVHPVADGEFLARELKKQDKKEPAIITGVYRTRINAPAMLLPLAKELSALNFIVPNVPEGMKIKDGAVVTAEVGLKPKSGATPVEIVNIISQDMKGAEVAIGIRNHEIPHVFPDTVLQQAKKLKPIQEPDLKDREDLRHIPIVTIDGEDAKDFDDAVWAEPWENEKIKGGYHIIVAIADVAFYVKDGSELDKEAFNRGNSVYFPGFVVPMLPEELSNDLCSLRPHEDRPTMVAHMWIDAKGKLHKYKFTRAVIHSAARLTYNQVQQALDGDIPDVVKPVMESTIQPLYGAYKALLTYRKQRGALDLEVPERTIVMDDNNNITAIEKRARFESHQLIEELMVLANVAAASELQTKGAPCLYRIHPEPGDVKIEALKMAFKDSGLKFSGDISPKAIQRTLDFAKDEHKETLFMTVLRSLEQARYDPQNVGHFGLALERYAHFTSPIRRYSDLIVHRSLIRQLQLTGYKDIKTPNKLISTADHLCITERRAQKAEWEVKDRLTARYYAEFLEKDFVARMTTFTKFGVFVSIDGGAAEGMLPYRFMNDDHYILNEKTNRLMGRRNKTTYKIGDTIEVTLIEANPISGRITFTLKGQAATSKLSRDEGKHKKPKRFGAKKDESSFKRSKRSDSDKSFKKDKKFKRKKR